MSMLKLDHFFMTITYRSNISEYVLVHDITQHKHVYTSHINVKFRKDNQTEHARRPKTNTRKSH